MRTLSPLDALLHPVRLACLIHAASVHSEPGSNSPWKKFSFFRKRFDLLIQVLHSKLGDAPESHIKDRDAPHIALRCPISKDRRRARGSPILAVVRRRGGYFSPAAGVCKSRGGKKAKNSAFFPEKGGRKLSPSSFLYTKKGPRAFMARGPFFCFRRIRRYCIMRSPPWALFQPGYQ